MASDMNHVVLSGRLTRDPEKRTSNNDNTFCLFGIASNRYIPKQDNPEVTFVDCVAFGRLAENISKIMAKGRPIVVHGRLNLNSWQDQQGNNRQKVGLVVDQFVQGNTSKNNGNSKGDTQQSSSDNDDEDIPF